MKRYVPGKPVLGCAFPKPRRIKTHPIFGGEDSLQRACEQYLDTRGLAYLHVPAAAYRICSWDSAASMGIKRDVAEHLRGVPDLTIYLGSVGDAVMALQVELKSGDNTRNEAQRRWEKQTGKVHEVRSLDELIALVDRCVVGMELPE